MNKVQRNKDKFVKKYYPQASVYPPVTQKIQILSSSVHYNGTQYDHSSILPYIVLYDYLSIFIKIIGWFTFVATNCSCEIQFVSVEWSCCSSWLLPSVLVEFSSIQ